MRAGFGGKEPYRNEFEVSEDFDAEMFAEEYQPTSSIHNNRFGRGHFYIRPQEKQGHFSAKRRNDTEIGK